MHRGKTTMTIYVAFAVISFNLIATMGIMAAHIRDLFAK